MWPSPDSPARISSIKPSPRSDVTVQMTFPASMHVAATLYVIEAEYPLLVEKPLAVALDEAEDRTLFCVIETRESRANEAPPDGPRRAVPTRGTAGQARHALAARAGGAPG